MDKLMKDTPILATEEDKKIFVDTLVNPPEANQKLKDAQKRHSKLFTDQK